MGIFRKYYGISDNIKENGYAGFMERFPILFQNKDKSDRETCMCLGIGCPVGWYYILEQLCTELEYSNLESVAKLGVAIVAEQVKEKYGTLRFYFDVRNVDSNGKIDNEHNFPNTPYNTYGYVKNVSVSDNEMWGLRISLVCASFDIVLQNNTEELNKIGNFNKNRYIDFRLDNFLDFHIGYDYKEGYDCSLFDCPRTLVDNKLEFCLINPP